MKKEILNKLRSFKKELRKLKKDVSSLPTERVSRKALRQAADAIANQWVEELRSPLEHKFGLSEEVIRSTSDSMKRLHVLSRPGNRTSSYISTIDQVLRKFDDKFILPIKQSTFEVQTVLDLQKLIPAMADPSESEYLQEAIDCASHGFRRAAIVMGWCAAIHRIQKKIQALGFGAFNKASTKLKNQSTGKFRKWNKEFSIATLSELQMVFDNDLIIVIEGMGLIDGNQAERLNTAFQYRNHSAHPGQAPIEDAHLLAFFSDINSIVFQNAKLIL